MYISSLFTRICARVHTRTYNVVLSHSRDLLNTDEILKLCALSTNRRGWSLFGLQYYGECWSDENANGLYARAGESKACFHGIGGINAYSVYRLYI